jgi:hypothetical protein
MLTYELSFASICFIKKDLFRKTAPAISELLSYSIPVWFYGRLFVKNEGSKSFGMVPLNILAIPLSELCPGI